MRDAARLPLSSALNGLAPTANGVAFFSGVRAAWAVLGLLVVGFACALQIASARFGYAYDVAEMPVRAMVAGLVAAGLIFALALPRLIRASLGADAGTVRLLTIGIVVAGLAARLVLFASEPILEDDYQRYLWDGAVTASGANPYAASPQTARALEPDTTLGRLAAEAGPVVRRINHPELTTIYPPVAQGAFALAYAVQPWSLVAWRSVILIFDLATLALVLLLLRETGRSPLWSALYWWNPLVLKELFNSAHMDAVLLPLILLALLLAVRGRQVFAGVSLALAAGAKIWPVLLLPLILRSLGPRPRRVALLLAVFCGLLAALAAPVFVGGGDASSGFVAYATQWQTNSALFLALERAAGVLLGAPGLPPASPGLVARLAIAIALGALAVMTSRRPIGGADDLVGRASLLVGALVLLSPTQFPWYAVWFAPFLAFRPWIGFLVLTVTAPLYYLFFYLAAHGETALVKELVVWIIWVPVWAALALEAAWTRLGPQQGTINAER